MLPLTMLANDEQPVRSNLPTGHSAASLERAAAAIARLDSALAAHPLAAVWAYRVRLDAVRRQAAVDGRMIDPWHLAAMIEGVRLGLDRASALIDRGSIFDAARYAFDPLPVVCRAKRDAAGSNRRGHGISHGGRRPPFAVIGCRLRGPCLARSRR